MGNNGRVARVVGHEKAMEKIALIAEILGADDFEFPPPRAIAEVGRDQIDVRMGQGSGKGANLSDLVSWNGEKDNRWWFEDAQGGKVAFDPATGFLTSKEYLVEGGKKTVKVAGFEKNPALADLKSHFPDFKKEGADVVDFFQTPAAEGFLGHPRLSEEISPGYFVDPRGTKHRGSPRIRRADSFEA